MPDARVFFTSGGSEAVDTALKFARIAHVQAGHPEKTIVISRAPSYHGVNYGGLSATGIAANQVGFGAMLPDFIQVPQNDLDAMGAVFAQNAGKVAAIIAEPVLGAPGVYPPSPGYLNGLRALADQYGAFLILDEVICGFGRLGDWWGAQHYGVVPDMVTFAKGVTSGYQPLGGVLLGAAVRAPLEADPTFLLRHGYTYSGHHTATAAGLANLKVIRNEGLVERAATMGAKLGAGLKAASQGRVAELRGEAAIWALTMQEGVSNVAVRNTMLEHGVIVRPIAPNHIAYCPPLVITDAQVDQVHTATEAALKAHT
jgi:adenosylmethionine-8-amino-7-oxononanoate aminotransferase